MRPSKDSFFRVIKKYWMFYVMMLPTLAIIIVNNYIPMAGILIAFKDINYALGIVKSPWVGLENFKYLFSTEAAWTITRNTIGYNAVFITLNLVVAVALAIMFNEMRNKLLAKIHQTTMFLPFILSWVVVAYLVLGFFSPTNGFVNNSLLPMLGMDSIGWYSTPSVWIWILPIVNTWKSVGYYTVIYLAAMIGIDDEYYEAATIDGASKWEQIKSITLPLITPVMVVMTLIQVGRIFYADFGLFFQVTQNAGALYSTTSVIDTYVYNGFLVMGDIGMSSAAGVYQSIVGFLLVLGSNLVVRKVSPDNALF